MSTWMVVEDEPDIYDVLLAMFGIWGIDGVAFVDGEEAVAWIDDVDNKRFVGELPELVLLDIRLPGDIEGPEVGERLRRSPVLRDMAIILITAYKLAPEKEKALMQQAGADSLIYKPLPRFNELKALLEDVLAKRRAISEQPASDTSEPATEATAPVKQKRKRRLLKRRTTRSTASTGSRADQPGDARSSTTREKGITNQDKD